MGSPLLFRADAWVVGFSCIRVCTLSEIPSPTMVVAFLSTCHDVYIVSTKLLLILCVCISRDAILIIISTSIPTKIVVGIRCWIDNILLERFCILSTIACMNMHVFETMNLIVKFEVACEVISVCKCLLLCQKSQRVLWSICIVGVFP